MINGSGAIVQTTGLFTINESRDFILLARIGHGNFTTVTSVTPLPRVIFNSTMDADDLATVIGAINGSGNVFSANGANLTINKSSGSTYRTGTNYTISKKSPNITTDAALVAATFSYRYQNGAGGFTTTTASANVDPSSYDDGTGTLATVPNNKFTIQRIYYSAAAQAFILTYGQAIYDNLNDAKNGILTEVPVVSPTFVDLALRSWLIVKKGITV